MEKDLVLSYIKRAYDTACRHGFHDVERSDAHWMMLVVSEIGEMVEADRKSRHAVYDAMDYCDKHSDEIDLESWCRYFERDVKDTIEDELADVCIRLFDFCGTRDVVPMMADDGLIDMRDAFKESFGAMTVCEQCYSFAVLVTDVTCRNSIFTSIGSTIGSLLSFAVAFADYHHIDLVWHIEHKMRYNESRAKLHGKGY